MFITKIYVTLVNEMHMPAIPVFVLASLTAFAQDGAVPTKPAAKTFEVEPGTHIPLSLINSVSTKHAAAGDRVYLETVFPILSGGRIVIPPGSYVMGTITNVVRPGKVKGRGEFYLRFDSLTLPNGVTRDFRARVSQLDGRASEELDRNEGAIKSEGNKGGDARTVGETAAAGASIGALDRQAWERVSAPLPGLRLDWLP
jgi:type IV secretion system protein VirB10